nr:hypothetical protein BaRGS_010706 [Batillaria attramentaria]
MAMDKLWKVMLAPSILLLFLFGWFDRAGAGDRCWGEWSPLSGCSKSCDMGIQTRWREWLTGQGEQPLENPYTNTEQYSCFQQACPQNGSWSEWGMWGQCTVACGGGVRKRHRDCNNPPPSNGGNECEGHKYDEEECKTLPCPPVPPNFNLSQCRHDGMVMCDNKVMCVSKSSRCDGTGTWQVRGGGSTSTVTVDSTTLTGLTVWNKTLTYNTVTVDSTTLTGLTVWNKTLTYNTVTVDSTTLTGLTVWNKTLTYNTVTVDSTTLTGLTVWNKTLTYNTVTVDSTTLTGLTVWNKTLTYNTVTVDSTTLTGLTVWNKTLTYNTVTVDSTTLTGLTVWNKTLTYNTVTVDSTTLTGLTVWNKTLTYNCFQQQGDYYVYSSEQTSLFDSYAVKIYFCWCLQAVATGYKLYELSDDVRVRIKQHL